ncbi:MAG: type II toxin-antitoxin system HicB family antitoxin [Bauldia sp.]|nr:type II toxin-antitoxin system HicB family antitoxin [Bauldia sp.]
MTTKYYLGVVEKDADSAYGMWFPDMPGCFPAADEFDDLPRVAAAVLRQHVEALESNGRPVPDTRSIAEDMADKEVRKAVRSGATTMLVPLLADPGRTVRVNVTVERGLLEQIDEAAGARGLTRSAFLAQAAREKIAG